MDGLIVMLIIFGIISRLNKKKKKQEQASKAAQKAEAFAEAAAVETIKAAKKAVKTVPEPVKKAAVPIVKAVQQEIPFTKEEWDRFLGNMEGKKPEKARPSAGKQIPAKQPMAEGISAPLKSTQGESEEEHRKHLEKIAADEKLHREKIETAREIRSMNRQKMRQAVVMSEILGKPVALRGRK